MHNGYGKRYFPTTQITNFDKLPRFTLKGSYFAIFHVFEFIFNPISLLALVQFELSQFPFYLHECDAVTCFAN